MPDRLTDSEIRQLASVFSEPGPAGHLLDEAGFPRARHPAWQGSNPEWFWRDVNSQLASGAMVEGRRRVMAAAHHWYPANQVFAAGAAGEWAGNGDVPGQVPLGPAEAPTDPPDGGSPTRRGRFGWLATSRLFASRRARVVTATAVAGVLVAAVLAGFLLAGRDTVAIRLEPVGRDVIDGFMPSVGNDVNVAATVPEGGGEGGVVPAETAGLFGGSRDQATCDRAKMVAFLRERPELLAAWTNVLGVDPANLETYVDALTPVVLRRDTVVTNHGFAAGKVTTYRAVLQAGTAVLVDEHGTPVVKCACGNPLTEPQLQPKDLNDAELLGERWSGFAERQVVQVQATTVEVNVFVVYDLDNDALFTRDRGSDGTNDRDLVPVTATDWRNTTYQVDCAVGQLTFNVVGGAGQTTHDGQTYALRVVAVAVGDLVGGSSAEAAVLLSCGPANSGAAETLLYVYRDGPNIVDRPRPPTFDPQTTGAFVGDQFEVVDRSLVVSASYSRTGTGSGGSGDGERRTLTYVWDGHRFVETTATTGVPTQSGDHDDGLTGTWRGTWSSSLADGTFEIVFDQQGSTLTGQLHLSDAPCQLDGPVSGNLVDNHIQFGVVESENESQETIAYDGVVSGDSISGTFATTCYSATGDWTASRVR